MDIILNNALNNQHRQHDDNLSRSSSGEYITGPSISYEKSKMLDITRDKPIKVAVRVAVPVRDHPKFNFVGKLLGPKGNSMKRLQEETMCKMAVLGKGSMKDRKKEENLRLSGDPRYTHLGEDLHVEISTFAPPAEAHARIAYALAEIRRFLVPDYHDDIRQEQMWEMQAISSTQGQNIADDLNGSTTNIHQTSGTADNDDGSIMVDGNVGGCGGSGSGGGGDDEHHHLPTTLNSSASILGGCRIINNDGAGGGGSVGGSSGNNNDSTSLNNRINLVNNCERNNNNNNMQIEINGQQNLANRQNNVILATTSTTMNNDYSGGTIGIPTMTPNLNINPTNIMPTIATATNNIPTTIPAYGMEINSVLLEATNGLLHPTFRDTRAINIAGGNLIRKRHLLGVPRSAGMTSTKRTVMTFLARAKHAQALHAPRACMGPSIGIPIPALTTLPSHAVANPNPNIVHPGQYNKNENILQVA